MKKVISILMAVLMIMSVAFVFASCSSKKYKDTDATLPSSTVQNETVTNSNGETVHATQSSTQSANQNSNSNGKDSKTTTKGQIKATRIPLQKKIKAVKKKKPRKRNQDKKQQRKTKRLMRYQAKQPSNQQLKSLNRVKYFFSLICLIKAILNQSFM